MAKLVLIKLFLFLAFLIKSSQGKEIYYRRRDSCSDNVTLDNEFVIRSFSRIHCAAICNSNSKCNSFLYRPEDNGCLPDFNGTRTMQNGWEYYNSVQLLNNSCNTPGFMNTFTEYTNMFHAGEDIRWYRTGGLTLVDKMKECEQSCLGDPTCRGYELSRNDGICSYEAISKWDKDLEKHTNYIYFNRNYDCGCPPTQKGDIEVCYTSTMDGNNVTYLCPNNGNRFTYMCTPAGWGLDKNQITC